MSDCARSMLETTPENPIHESAADSAEGRKGVIQRGSTGLGETEVASYVGSSPTRLTKFPDRDFSSLFCASSDLLTEAVRLGPEGG